MRRVAAGSIVGSVLVALLAPGCVRERAAEPEESEQERGSGAANARKLMLEEQIEARGVSDPAVLSAMGEVPRERFVPEIAREGAYSDRPLSIGHGQTISQPYIVALMSEALQVEEGDRVLEVGTGSGYQAAVLAEMGCEVWSIEIVPELAESAQQVLEQLDYDVHVRAGDGYRGWPEQAPFDGVIVTAAPDEIPPPLIEQLATGGRLVIPVGSGLQHLTRVTKTEDGTTTEELLPVRFVPMTGEAQD